MAERVEDQIIYPDSDGERMAENTLQFEWIVVLKENLDAIRPDFVAGDLLWYPVKGDPKTRVAPDTLVAVGRPKGYRGSYKQWEEDHVPLTCVFEVLSPGNGPTEMERKLAFYERFGVEEYYVVDPDAPAVKIYVRGATGLEPVPDVASFRSPRLGIRFEPGPELRVFGPNEQLFRRFGELKGELDDALGAAEAAFGYAEESRGLAEAARFDAEAARADADAAREAEAKERARADALATELAALRARFGDGE